jgi:hypothetical protein
MPGPVKTDSGDIAEAGDMVVYVAGYPAIYGKQPLYFKDPTFQARAAIPAPKNSDKLRQVSEVKKGEGITLGNAYSNASRSIPPSAALACCCWVLAAMQPVPASTPPGASRLACTGRVATQWRRALTCFSARHKLAYSMRPGSAATSALDSAPAITAT